MPPRTRKPTQKATEMAQPRKKTAPAKKLPAKAPKKLTKAQKQRAAAAERAAAIARAEVEAVDEGRDRDIAEKRTANRSVTFEIAGSEAVDLTSSPSRPRTRLVFTPPAPLPSLPPLLSQPPLPSSPPLDPMALVELDITYVLRVNNQRVEDTERPYARPFFSYEFGGEEGR
jgi:hypothetical protein